MGLFLMLTGVAILAAGLGGGCGWLASRFWWHRVWVRAACGCGHGFGHHAELGCQGENRVPINGRDSMRRCGCRVYCGPDPELVRQALDRSLDRTMQRYGNLFARLKGRDESD